MTGTRTPPSRHGAKRLAAALLLLSAILAGCAAKRQLVTPQSPLSADTLRADGIAVFGVTVVDEVEQVRPPLVEALEQTLFNLRPDLAVLNAARMRDELGVAAYRRILMGYQQGGSLSEKEIGELSAALRNQARFLILVRVEKDAIHMAEHGNIHIGTRTGTSGSVSAGLASRSTRVRVALYDLAAGGVVQSAVYASSSDDPVPESVWSLPRDPAIPRPGDPLPPHDEPPTDVPSLVHAVVEGFRAFADDLPGPVLPPPPTAAPRDSVADFRYWAR